MSTILLDVRSPEEFAMSHRKGAVNLPIEKIIAGDLGILTEQNISQTTPIECYCASGARAHAVVYFLGQKGYTNVQNVGGFSQ